MGGMRMIGAILLAAGLLGLASGHIEYTKETREARIGPFKFSVTEKETAVIPGWASVAAIIAGVVLLVIPRR
jgi:hypothetical protein